MARRGTRGRKTTKNRSEWGTQPKATGLTRRQILKAIPPALSVAASLSTLATNGRGWLPGTQQPVTHRVHVDGTLNLKENTSIVLKPAVMTWTGQEVVIREG
jgi:hypothetical protein